MTGAQYVFTAGGQSIACSLESWHRGKATFPGTPPRLISGSKPSTPTAIKIAANATWKDANTLDMTWRYHETPHSDTLTCRFDEDRVSISFLDSITAMDAKAKDLRAPLIGRIVA